MTTIVIAMSGGVDSSVAAALLKEMGYEVVGVTMRIWDGEIIGESGVRHGCYGPSEEEDVEDARKVARVLGIPFHVFDLQQEYRTEVLDYFCREYLVGRTPNPCVRCNRTVKFDALVRRVVDSGITFDYFATGHYVRTVYDGLRNRYLLKRAIDINKDQSYFLYSLSQEQLGRCLFPLGDYIKEEVKAMAMARGLCVSHKAESQDFIGGGYYSIVGGVARPGLIVDGEGRCLGEHRGIQFYTIGQRKGLGIAAREPLYVTAIDQARNVIVVGTREEVYGNELTASDINWVAIENPDDVLQTWARIRYRHQEAEAVVTPLDEHKVHVRFKEPQMAITPGQAVVFYEGDIVVGGGTIEMANNVSGNAMDGITTMRH